MTGILDIVYEKLEPYFAGQRSAVEAAKKTYPMLIYKTDRTQGNGRISSERNGLIIKANRRSLSYLNSLI